MKKNRQLPLLILIVFVGFMSSCSISNQSMKYPNYHIEFYKADFDYSPQVTAEATSVRVLGIDWKRLFKWETGQLSSDRFDNKSHNIAVSGSVVTDVVGGALSAVIPVLGDLEKGKVSSYALFRLMKENPGYDVVIYPQYETKKFIFPIFYSKRSVKVTARLGRIR